MAGKQNLYLGKAGHLNVMSEFLVRGWNVAIPEVDIGDDIFVVQDDIGKLQRVQVKTATSSARKNGYSARFNLPMAQLRNITTNPIHYAFVVRYRNRWTVPIIIRQDNLLEHFEKDRIGSAHDGVLNLYFSYAGRKVKCSKVDMTKYVGDYSDFPIISH